MKRKIAFIILALLLLTSCGNNKTSTKTKNTSSKTVSEVMAEGDKNHGGNVVNPDDKKSKVKVSIPNDVGNISGGGSNMQRSGGTSGVKSNQLNASDIDIDLTSLSSTMVYSEVYNMMNEPEQYVGKMVRMNGKLAVYIYPERNYYTCIIKDATACCQQGMEFIWQGNHKYPDDYPAEGSGIIVTGVFDIYYEGNNKYCQLKDAHLVKSRA